MLKHLDDYANKIQLEKIKIHRTRDALFDKYFNFIYEIIKGANEEELDKQREYLKKNGFGSVKETIRKNNRIINKYKKCAKNPDPEYDYYRSEQITEYINSLKEQNELCSVFTKEVYENIIINMINDRREELKTAEYENFIAINKVLDNRDIYITFKLGTVEKGNPLNSRTSCEIKRISFMERDCILDILDKLSKEYKTNKVEIYDKFFFIKFKSEIEKAGFKCLGE